MLAEGVGVEPTGPEGPPVFKTGALGHSATPPNQSGCLSQASIIFIADTGAKSRSTFGFKFRWRRMTSRSTFGNRLFLQAAGGISLTRLV